MRKKRPRLLIVYIYVCYRRIWVKHIGKTLNERPQGKKYVLLRSSQLVGTALVVYARADVLPAVRNIEASMKKV